MPGAITSRAVASNMMLMPREWGYRKRFRTEYDARAPEVMTGMRGPPTADTLDDPWEDSARSVVRIEMIRRNLSYAHLVTLLEAVGVQENERNLRNKIARGSFSAVFMLQCLHAMGVRTPEIGRELDLRLGPEPLKFNTRQEALDYHRSKKELP